MSPVEHRGGIAPCVAAARMVCRAIAVTAAASGPVPHTSPMTSAQRRSSIGEHVVEVAADLADRAGGPVAHGDVDPSMSGRREGAGRPAACWRSSGAARSARRCPALRRRGPRPPGPRRRPRGRRRRPDSALTNCIAPTCAPLGAEGHGDDAGELQRRARPSSSSPPGFVGVRRSSAASRTRRVTSRGTRAARCGSRRAPRGTRPGRRGTARWSLRPTRPWPGRVRDLDFGDGRRRGEEVQRAPVARGGALRPRSRPASAGDGRRRRARLVDLGEELEALAVQPLPVAPSLRLRGPAASASSSSRLRGDDVARAADGAGDVAVGVERHLPAALSQRTLPSGQITRCSTS